MDEVAIYYSLTKYKLRWLLVYEDNTADEFLVDLRVDPEYKRAVEHDMISVKVSFSEYKRLVGLLA
jgi:hypothetical protein